MLSCVVQDGSSIFDSETARGTVGGNTSAVGGSVERVIRISTSGGGGVPIYYNTYQQIYLHLIITSTKF